MSANLGISQLTDDQLLELLQEACQELAARDPIVTQAAQQTIFTEAEKLKLVRNAVREATLKVRRDYEKQIKAEAIEEMQEAFDRGELKLPGAEECRLALESAKTGQQAVVANLVERVKLTLAMSSPDEKVLHDLARRVYHEYMEMIDPGAGKRLRDARNFAEYEAVRSGRGPKMKSVPLWPGGGPSLNPSEARALRDLQMQMAEAVAKVEQEHLRDMAALNPKTPWVADPLTAADVQAAYDAINKMAPKTKWTFPKPFPWEDDDSSGW